MPKKLTIEFIKKQFEKENYILLTNEYKNVHQKLDYICPNGHKHSITWSSWQQGKRCSYCAGNGTPTIKFIKKEFEKKGCKLLSNEYKNNYTKLEYICPEGHGHSIRWNDWQQGHRCPYCYGNVKPTIKFIRKKFEKEGYKLLTKIYKNSRQKLNYICPEGHRHSITWSDWQQGYRCLYCAGLVKLDINFIKKEFEKEKYKLLSKSYKNSQTKLIYECDKGHRHSMVWGSWQQGRRCPSCHALNCCGEGNSNWKGGISCEPYCHEWSFKEFKDMIKERDGYKCLNPDCHKNCNHLPLHVHHIDNNKKNCDPNNLITLCVSCNSRANKDREWHTSWYQTILNKRYYERSY